MIPKPLREALIHFKTEFDSHANKDVPLISAPYDLSLALRKYRGFKEADAQPRRSYVNDEPTFEDKVNMVEDRLDTAAIIAFGLFGHNK